MDTHLHIPPKPFVCVFCQKPFNRNDALKRHWKTCKIRLEQALDVPQVPSKSRGRRPKACDRCCRLKRACTSTHPCGPCVSKRKTCTYARIRPGVTEHEAGGEECLQDDSYLSPGFQLNNPEFTFDCNAMGIDFDCPVQAEICDLTMPSDLVLEVSCDSINAGCGVSLDNWNVPWVLGEEFALAESLIRRPTELDINALIMFPFLGNFTKTSGLISSFECGSREWRLAVTQESCKLALERESLSLQMAPEPRAYQWTEYIHGLDYSPPSIGIGSSFDTIDSNVGDDYISLLLKTHDIVAQIRELTVRKPRGSTITTTWSQSLEAMCYDFFSLLSVKKFLDLFWSCWYPNWPAIHKPSFVIGESSSILLAAMVIIGACLSPCDRDCALANVWFNTVEEKVFNDDIWSQGSSLAWQDAKQRGRRNAQLEILQAAYCVCLYQTWEGCKESKRRVRRHRYSAITGVSELFFDGCIGRVRFLSQSAANLAIRKASTRYRPLLSHSENR
ncbi:hypothetical protein K469DRAFT_671488 [Zopfia rhizophila CBS 207.26]|uniref:Xylanolytic transcriptional activator regulatory domain-containing protein n=1 Tax=Zopfia rhizophila CBS 207.26 TaxID=1314779 RepID=A0A6A6DQT3_9PEZI|nr:hypothetical protein K469DRAFT_671488 [Zopfia rhizophila CBS 207.26]